jgi:phosphatidylserine/phosphatidylglycerophosphate/cardiolipin synthase-like enzyme
MSAGLRAPAESLRFPPILRRRAETLRSLEALHGAANGPTPAALARSHARTLASTLGRPLVGGNRVDILVDGPSTYASMFAAIEGARDHVNVESYILEDEGPGESLAELLLHKRAAGVCVNVIFDSFGSLRTSAEYFRRLRGAGVTLCEYNPVSVWRRPFNARCTCATTASCSSSMAALVSSAASTSARSTRRALSLAPRRDQAGGAFGIHHDRLLRSAAPPAASARERGAPRRRRAAAPSGVSDSWPALAAGRSFYGRLLHAGIHIYECHDAILHAKTAVIDGVWSTVGWSNMDWRSFLHNAEINAIGVDPKLGAELEQLYLDDLARSRPVTLAQWTGRRLTHRLKEWVACKVEFFL